MVDAQEIYNGTQRAVFIPYRVLLLTTKQGYQGSTPDEMYQVP